MGSGSCKYSRIRWMTIHCFSVYVTPVSACIMNDLAWNDGNHGRTGLVLPLLAGCGAHHVTNEPLLYRTVLVHALGILWQLKWSLASRLILGGRPPLQCILLVRGGQRVQTPF